MKNLLIFINGILNKPGAANGWTDRAAITINRDTPDKAEKFEYFSGALTRRIKQEARAKALAWVIGEYQRRPGLTVHLVGHSNGADIILRALAHLHNAPPWKRPLGHVHLVAPATEADCRRNGIAHALQIGLIKSVTVHVALEDKAMNWARASKIVAGFAGLGYGCMGKTGPENIPHPIAGMIITKTYKDFGHSTFWDPAHFPKFLASVYTDCAA